MIINPTDYLSGIPYKNRLIDFKQSEKGKIVLINDVYDFEYYLGENLGNTRLTFNIQNSVATALQRDNYMPFGYEISNGSPAIPKNEYLYDKKELQ